MQAVKCYDRGTLRQWNGIQLAVPKNCSPETDLNAHALSRSRGRDGLSTFVDRTAIHPAFIRAIGLTRRYMFQKLSMKTTLFLLAVMAFLESRLLSQDNRSTAPGPTRPVRGGFGGPIELGPDDKSAFPPVPETFDQARDGIGHGKLEMVEYSSKSVGTTRKALVYTPPGYSEAKKYPGFYSCTVMGGVEEECHGVGLRRLFFKNWMVVSRAGRLSG